MAQGTRKSAAATISFGIGALMVLLTLAACSASSRQTASRPQVAGATQQAANGPATVERLRAQQNGPGVDIDVVADRPLVWTTYRDPEGNLVVELPNALPADQLGTISRTSGLVSSVDVERLDDAERPLTRLVIRTRSETEHALTSDGDMLRLAMVPAGGSGATARVAEAPPRQPAGTPPTMATDPMPASEPVMEPAAPLPASQPPSGTSRVTFASGDFGTPESPRLGPPVEGVVASRLMEVSALESGGETVIRVEGDGEFAYATFRLQNPDRFVIDLDGVTNTSLRSTVPVDSGTVDQVRVGQFKARPDAVSRVVFDLQSFVPPVIERSADGLTIRFGDGAGTGAGDAIAELGPPPGVGVAAEDVPVEDMATPPKSAEAPEVVVAAQTPPAMEETVAESQRADVPAEVMVETRPPASPPASSPMPTYRPEASPATTDVARLEAQNVQVSPPAGSGQQEIEIPPSFESLVVSTQQRTYIGDPISMSLRDADLVETLRTFSKISDLNFVIQPNVNGSVTVELNSVPWDQALEQILKINNLGMDIDGTIVRIAPLAQLRAEAQERARLAQLRQTTVPLTTIVRRLSYADVDDVSDTLSGAGRRSRGRGNGGGNNSILSRRGSVQVDERTQTLIIRELPEVISTVMSVIDFLDTPQPQVRIEARIVEATKNFTRTLGIAWNFNGEASNRFGNSTGLEFPNNVTADGGVNLLTGGNNGFLNLSLGNVLNSFTLDAQLLAAENEGLINVVSAPSIMTLSNERASIQSGVQVPIQTVANNTVTTQFVNATLQLGVEPHVTAEGTIQMEIQVQKREPQTSLLVPGATNAPIATRDATTTVIVRDGGTAVIGGIYEVTNNQSQGRVPGLANVPILKHLFRNRSRDNRNEELLIFVTPRIIQN